MVGALWGRGRDCLAGLISVPSVRLSGCCVVCLISVPSCFSLSACVLVCACLPPSVSLLSTNLPHLLCSSVITPGQECYLISSLLAASGLHPLPFFLPADACLPWQP